MVDVVWLIWRIFGTGWFCKTGNVDLSGNLDGCGGGCEEQKTAASVSTFFFAFGAGRTYNDGSSDWNVLYAAGCTRDSYGMCRGSAGFLFYACILLRVSEYCGGQAVFFV